MTNCQKSPTKIDVWKMTKEEIKKLRLDKKMSRKQFGEMLGVEARTVEAWEQGLRNPSLSVLILLKRI